MQKLNKNVSIEYRYCLFSNPNNMYKFQGINHLQLRVETYKNRECSARINQAIVIGLLEHNSNDDSAQLLIEQVSLGSPMFITE